MFKEKFLNELNINKSVMFAPNSDKQKDSNLAENDFVKNLEFVQLQDSGSGIILLSQDYTKLFYDPYVKLQLPIQRVTVRFYDHEKDNSIWLMKLILANQEISLKINQEVCRKHRIKMEDRREKSKLPLFPSAVTAPFMLQRKLWIQINKLTKTLSISVGDIVENEDNVLFSHFFWKQQENKEGWSNEVDQFLMPNYGKIIQAESQKKKKVNLLELVKYFKVSIDIAKGGNPATQQKVQDFFAVKVLNIYRLFNPVLQKHPSLLKPSVASLQSMPRAIKILYNYLQNLQLQNLPDYEQKPEEATSKRSYLQWRDFQYALHHSLMTPFGYTTDGKPIGILNHLYKIKMKKQYKPLSFNQLVQGFSSREEMMSHIYGQRGGYIRLQLLPHEGLSPGSMAVMEIWPPYHCSSIHNHGASYGLIKVLSGSIRVQNYTQLSFQALDQKPYLQNDYAKGQFTWLSECSFGIHRLINLHHQTCVTLQAYYRHQNTKQYFSVVGKSQNKDVYKQYYPQNDWKCYLQLVNEKTEQKSSIKKEDMEFIKRIISTYDLQFFSQVNCSFEKLALILRDEYDYAVNFIYSLQPSKVLSRTSSLNTNKHVIIWVDKDVKNIDLIHSKYLKRQKLQIIKKTPSQIPTQGFKQVLRLLKAPDRKIIFIYNIGTLDQEEDAASRNAIVNTFFGLICRVQFKDPLCIGLCYQYELPSIQRYLQEQKLTKIRLQISLKDVYNLIIQHFKD